MEQVLQYPVDFPKDRFFFWGGEGGGGVGGLDCSTGSDWTWSVPLTTSLEYAKV